VQCSSRASCARLIAEDDWYLRARTNGLLLQSFSLKLQEPLLAA
jgi:hypothetical protein